ncbi:unnamed protein product [Rhizophagus irregularis]|nr:unnamed protein product [Rhizophagus irregularis]
MDSLNFHNPKTVFHLELSVEDGVGPRKGVVIVAGVGNGEDCERDDILSFIFLYLSFKEFRVCSISCGAKSSFLIRGSRIDELLRFAWADLNLHFFDSH